MEIPGHWVGMMGLKPFKYDNTHVPVAQVAFGKRKSPIHFQDQSNIEIIRLN